MNKKSITIIMISLVTLVIAMYLVQSTRVDISSWSEEELKNFDANDRMEIMQTEYTITALTIILPGIWFIVTVLILWFVNMYEFNNKKVLSNE